MKIRFPIHFLPLLIAPVLFMQLMLPIPDPPGSGSIVIKVGSTGLGDDRPDAFSLFPVPFSGELDRKTADTLSKVCKAGKIFINL